MIKALLWDIDGTVLDFKNSERCVIKRCFETFPIGKYSDEKADIYSAVNLKYWEMVERSQIDKSSAMTERFKEFLEILHQNTALASDIGAFFEKCLPQYTQFIDYAKETLVSLMPFCKQYAVTNGTRDIQNERLKKSGLDKIFDNVFISDEIGYEKPSVNFFQAVLNCIEPYSKNEILIVGDSLTSDIAGANNIGIKSCWFNPHNKKNTTEIKADYEISSIDRVSLIVQKENNL